MTDNYVGLSNESPSSWPEYDADVSAIDRMADKKHHEYVLNYMTARLNASERKMQQFYNRWRANEYKVQGYINLPDYEKILKAMNRDGKPPSPVSITVPYAYATAWTVVTYLLHTFCGRKPIFQVASHKSEVVKSAKMMEQVLQWNADSTRLVRHFYQMFMDGQVYGVGAVRTLWTTRKARRAAWQKPKGLMNFLSSTPVRVMEERLVFEGNEVAAIDPFMFFPDPNVPMAEVNRKGEFVFWRVFEGKHRLLAAQASEQLKYVDKVSPMPANQANSLNSSARGAGIGADSSAGIRQHNEATGNYYQVDQGSVMILPKELGLGDSMAPERWLVSILNKTQIVQLEPLDVDYDMHPVAVIEPSTFGYGFGQPGLLDFIGPLQDTLSWLINSHVHNVRSVLNNSFVVDPSMVEMQDLKSNEPGKLIRLKRAAFGQDVRQAITQLNVVDITRSHIEDLEVFRRLGDMISAVSDNIRGLQDSGGRKTATEVRTSAEAGASRLAAQARLISAQGIVDLTEQMSVNLQSKLSQEVYISVVGRDGIDTPLKVSPDSLAGDFYYPVHDGTLPIDRVAMLDVWKEILMGVSQDPNLSQQFSVPDIFQFVAKLGGAENIDSFRVQVAPPSAEPPANAVPLS